jgi:hypothetical protein
MKKLNDQNSSIVITHVLRAPRGSGELLDAEISRLHAGGMRSDLGFYGVA